MADPTLVIGNKNYSTWSLRPWLTLKAAGIAFEETVIPLDQPETRDAIRKVNPVGLVPALILDGAVINDSLAICEWAAERAPSLWPSDPLTRAQARSAACVMHSGYPNLRNEASMNLKRKPKAIALSDAARSEAKAMTELWSRALQASGGPFLFGDWSIADAMFTPAATRFRIYEIESPEDGQRYIASVLGRPDFRKWERAALEEPWISETMERP